MAQSGGVANHDHDIKNSIIPAALGAVAMSFMFRRSSSVVADRSRLGRLGNDVDDVLYLLADKVVALVVVSV